MSGIFGGLLVLGSWVVFFLSAFALIKPLKSIQLGSRKRALIGIGLSIAMFFGGGMALAGGGSQTSQHSPPALPTAPTAPRTEARPQTPAAPDRTADVVAFQARYIGATDGCKAAFQRVADQANSGAPDAQALYDLASAAKDQCRATRRAVSQLKDPVPLMHPQSSAFLSSLRSCEIAYIAHEATADRLMKAINGGFSPALVARYRESANEAAGNRRVCEEGIASAADATVRLEANAKASS